MTKIEFLVSVDGSEPKPLDVQEVADFAKLILMMRDPTSTSPPPKPPGTQRPRPIPPGPPVGERSIDYAIKAALTFNGASFSLNELLASMESVGWKTRAESKRNRVNTVRATIRDHDDFSNHGEGQWSYDPKQENSPQPDSQESN